jgi:hypothetical protein
LKADIAAETGILAKTSVSPALVRVKTSGKNLRKETGTEFSKKRFTCLKIKVFQVVLVVDVVTTFASQELA